MLLLILNYVYDTLLLRRCTVNEREYINIIKNKQLVDYLSCINYLPKNSNFIGACNIIIYRSMCFIDEAAEKPPARDNLGIMTLNFAQRRICVGPWVGVIAL